MASLTVVHVEAGSIQLMRYPLARSRRKDITMRSARMLLATAAASAALALATPGAAFASHGGGEGGHDDSSYSKEKGSDDDHDKGSGGDHDKDYSKEDGGGRDHDKPRGGMHTGGGALATVLTSDDWGSGGDDSRFDPESYRDKGDKGDKGDKEEKGDKGDKGGKGDKDDRDEDSGRDKDDWGGGGGGGGGGDHDKPRGGMHTGGGALATPGVTTGGLAVLAVGATGMYALRRKKAAQPAS
ncbi:hypothetical protein EDD94_4808 [Streptomyces sp. PanSC9]|nr:hypothetical protein EDD94_4808 [Streptomyces sp. PanSC9]